MPYWAQIVLAMISVMSIAFGATGFISGIGERSEKRGVEKGHLSAVIEQNAEGMKSLGEGLKEVALTLREFTLAQNRTNEEMWNAIQVQADQRNRDRERGMARA